ncbi:MAG: PorV/PorQ family protein [Ignavibacteria bacterium]|jgi:hypothetical protein
MNSALILTIIFISTMEVYAQILPAFGDERIGISIGSALKIGAGARATGMGESVVSVIDDANAMYWNPAGMTQSKSNHVVFTQTQWFAGLQHRFASGLYKLDDESSIGFSIANLNAGSIKVTTEFRPFGTGETINFGTSAFSLGYARQFTEQFSAGITVRYLHEQVGTLRMNGVLFDAGTFYRTGLGTSRFAVAISNFGGKLSPTGTISNQGSGPNFNGAEISAFQSFDPPINFRIGFAMEPILDSMQSWTVSLQLNHPNDNAENYSLGTEYAVTFSEAFPAKAIIRGGYIIGPGQISGGAGIHVPISGMEYILQADYSFTNISDLGGIHRFTLGMLF